MKFIVTAFSVLSINLYAFSFIPTTILTNVEKTVVSDWGWEQHWSGVSHEQYLYDDIFGGLSSNDIVMLAVARVNTDIYKVAAAAPWSIISQSVSDPIASSYQTTQNVHSNVAWYNHTYAMGFNPFVNDVTSHHYDSIYGSSRSDSRVMSWLKSNSGNNISTGGRVGTDVWSLETQSLPIAADWTRVVLKYTNSNHVSSGTTNDTDNTTNSAFGTFISFTAPDDMTSIIASNGELETFSTGRVDFVVNNYSIYGNFYSTDNSALWAASEKNGAGLKIRWNPNSGADNTDAWGSYLFQSSDFINSFNLLDTSIGSTSMVRGAFGWINPNYGIKEGRFALVFKNSTGWKISDDYLIYENGAYNHSGNELIVSNSNPATFSAVPSDLTYYDYDPSIPNQRGLTELNSSDIDFNDIAFIGFRLHAHRNANGGTNGVNFGITEFHIEGYGSIEGVPDGDLDGLSDDDENNIHGTNPNLSDTDQDGINDGAEILVHGTNPLQIDSDSDGLNDYQEVFLYGTSPTNITDVTNSTDVIANTVSISWHSDWEFPEFHYYTNRSYLIFLDVSETSLNSYNWNSSLKMITDWDFNESKLQSSVVNIPNHHAFEGSWYWLNEGSEQNGSTFIQYNPNWDLDYNGQADGEQIASGTLLNITNSFSLQSDLDGDNLLVYEEAIYGTNPFSNDSDNDGLTDDYEISISLTDPNVADSDSDTYLDGIEVSEGSDPLSFDSLPDNLDFDGDGLTNAEEIAEGTDRRFWDSDGDSLSDSYEVNTSETNPLLSDTDQDGLDDYVEVNSTYQINSNVVYEFIANFLTWDQATNDAAIRGGILACPSTHSEWQALLNSPTSELLGGTIRGSNAHFWMGGLLKDGYTPSSSYSYNGVGESESSPQAILRWLNGDEFTDHKFEYVIGYRYGDISSSDLRTYADSTSEHWFLMSGSFNTLQYILETHLIVTNYYSDANQSDTDGDGLNDSVEVLTYKTDPNKADTDGDGYNDKLETDLSEIIIRFNPFNNSDSEYVTLSNAVSLVPSLSSADVTVLSNQIINLTYSNNLLTAQNTELITTNDAYAMLDAAYLDDVLIKVSNSQAMLIMSIEQSSNLAVQAWDSAMQVTNMIPIDVNSEAQFFKFDID